MKIVHYIFFLFLFQLQSSKYSSKRDYERDRSSNYRDRDISPAGGGGPLNNGNSSSYRSQSPEIDSPSSRGHGGSHDIRDRGDHRGGGDRFPYIQKMRDRERDIYKKDKYSGELHCIYRILNTNLLMYVYVVCIYICR